jgi:hypothetical protein
MIRFVLAAGNEYTLDQLKNAREAPAIETISYDKLISSRRLKWGTYVFTDFDRLGHADLELAGRIYVQLKDAGLKVINNPAKVMTRYSLLRRLYREGVNDFNVYRADELPVDVRFPAFVRNTRGHGRLCSDLISTRQEIELVLRRQMESGIPAVHLMIIEYAGEPVCPGLYRKLAMFRFGPALISSPCVHDHQWLVKTGPNCIADELLYEEDFRNIGDNPHAGALQRAFDIAEIEYGRADFGFYQGRLQVFEINTNPHILAPRPHPSATRAKALDLAWGKLLDATRLLDSGPGRDVLLPKDHALNRYRKWNRFLYRARSSSSSS